MIALDPSGLVLNGTPLPLWSGALHYFRTSPAHWRPALQAARDLGLPAIESYVPWGVHEVAPGHMRFSGQYDLGRFLDLCAELDLKVILRPGPHINAELPFFGFPERLCGRERAMKTAAGLPMFMPAPPRMFTPPSYAHPGLYADTAAWYAAVAEVVAPRLYPSGPVVALQVDNEQPLFFRTGAYDGDYSEPALAAYAAWLEAHGLPQSKAPRAFASDGTPEDLLPHLRWLAFKDSLPRQALTQLAGLLRTAGLSGVPLFHNFPPAEPGPFDVAAAEGVLDIAGIDMYHARREYELVRRRSLYLLGSSRLPYVPEMGAGSFPWGPPLTDEDSQATLLTALGAGVRAFNLYMLVERDRWYGSPISETGQARPRADFYRRLLAGLRAASAPALTPHAPVGVLLPREYGRLSLCASHLGPLSPVWLDWLGVPGEMAYRHGDLGLRLPVQADFPRRRDALLAALSRLGRRHALLSPSCDDAQLAQRRALVVPTYDMLNTALGHRLRRFADDGGTLLIGPLVPDRDESFAPCDHRLAGHPRIHLLPADLDGLLDALRAALPAPDDDEAAFAPEPPAADQRPVDVLTHRDAAGRARLLAVGGGKDTGPARLRLPGPTTLSDLVTGERLHGDAGVEVPLAPGMTRLFAIE